jgi:hypothetical protein
MLFAVALFTLSCRSVRDDSAVDIIDPVFEVHQVGGTGQAARNVTGPISVNYRIGITNRSSEALTLQQLRMETLGQGAYVVQPTSRPFERLIGPGKTEVIEVWLPAFAQDTILGANGPVTIRGTAYFNSSLGKLQRIFMQQLNDGMGGQRRPN